jgi:predicted small metal-binding protein
MKEFKCKDAGHACDWKARGADEDDVIRQAKDHGRTKHGLKTEDMPDEKIRPLVHDIA